MKKDTIDSLLDSDTIVGIAEDIVENKENIEDLVTIYSCKDCDSFVWATNGIPMSRVVWMLERIKFSLVSGKA